MARIKWKERALLAEELYDKERAAHEDTMDVACRALDDNRELRKEQAFYKWQALKRNEGVRIQAPLDGPRLTL